MSYPYDQRSVNKNISKESKTVHYSTVAEVIDLIRGKGRGCYLAKSDISEAFRLLPLHRDVYHLMGFTWKGANYYDLCLLMGCAISCKLFSIFSDAIMFAVKKLGAKNTVKILDDFLFVELFKDQCSLSLDIFLKLCVEAQIPTAQLKTVGRQTSLVFLGVLLVAMCMMASLPKEKLITYRDHIEVVMKQKKIRLKELQSIIGQLQFATCVVTPGKAFLRRLINLTICHTKLYLT